MENISVSFFTCSVPVDILVSQQWTMGVWAYCRDMIEGLGWVGLT